MPSVKETVAKISAAPSWDQRIALIRLIPHDHGTSEHQQIYAAVARSVYVPHLSPEFAYIHQPSFYGPQYFQQVYEAARSATDDFSQVDENNLASAIENDPRTLLVFRTIVGLTKDEFAHATNLVAAPLNLKGFTGGKVDAMERKGTATSSEQAQLAAATLSSIMDGKLFSAPPGNLCSKQAKPDTQEGWASVRQFAQEGVPFSLFLHQRHYGGAFRQVLDATSSLRGDLIEDAVEALFRGNGVPHIRTGGHKQGDIAKKFQVNVTPAPDFVVFDKANNLKAMLECKGANDGGTARDKASRFKTLRDESIRLGGIPLIAVLSGLGWRRVNDTLGPVLRDTDGRVFTLSTLAQLLQVDPFPSLVGLER